VELRAREAESKAAAESRERRELEQRLRGELAARESVDRALKDAIAGRSQQVDQLVSLQARLEQEQHIYKNSADQLKALYEEEKARTAVTLKFYQTSYEDQSLRVEELSRGLQTSHADLVRLQAERDSLRKSFEDAAARARLPAAAPGENDAIFSGEISQLKISLQFASEDAQKWRELATAAESAAEENLAKLGKISAEDKSLRLRILSLETELASRLPPDSQAADRASERIAEAEKRAEAAEARAREEAVRRGEEAGRSEEILHRARVAEEQLAQARGSADARVAESQGLLIDLRAALSRAVSEKDDLERQVSELMAENRKLSEFFAKELKGDREASAVLQNLQVSKSIAASREEQATVEAHRQRARAEFLLSENASLRKRADELELGCEELRRSLASFDDMKIQVANLQLSQAEAARVAADAKSLRERLASLETVQAEAVSLQAKIAAAESERVQAVQAAAEAAAEAEAFRTRHKDMSLRLAETDLGEVEKLKAQVDKLRIEKEQSEKARAQLAATLKAAREEAATRKEAPAELVKLKDKKISELEEQIAKAVPEWGQMLSVQQDYKAALTKLLAEGKRQAEPHAEETAAKSARMED